MLLNYYFLTIYCIILSQYVISTPNKFNLCLKKSCWAY